MKAALIILSLVFSASAFAELDKRKPMKVNFNSMIEANHQESRKLHKDLSDQGFGARPATETSLKGKKRVADFLDAEVGWGEAPQVVDRRFK